MKKSLIAIAITSALTATSAFAADSNVTVYGDANASFDVVSGGQTTTQVSSNDSKIGFKGSEDIGGGTSVIWQIEALVNLDSARNGNPSEQDGAANTFASGDSFVGLSGDWGTALLGRHDTPYKIANRGYDLFADTVADNRSLMGQAGAGAFGTGVVNHNARLDNVAAYISPSMAGFTIAAAYVAAAENATVNGDDKASAYSVAVLYGNKDIGLNVSAAYQTVKIGTAPNTTGLTVLDALPDGSKATAYSLGASYTIAGFTVVGEVERETSGGPIGDVLKQTNWTIGGKYAFTDSDAVKLAYTKAGDADSLSDTSANLISVGYDHNLSKRTSVYALYTRLKNDDNVGYALGYSDATSAGVFASDKSSLSAFSLGIKHSF